MYRGLTYLTGIQFGYILGSKVTSQLLATLDAYCSREVHSLLPPR
jgi:hypothetical protein